LILRIPMLKVHADVEIVSTLIDKYYHKD